MVIWMEYKGDIPPLRFVGPTIREIVAPTGVGVYCGEHPAAQREHPAPQRPHAPRRPEAAREL